MTDPIVIHVYGAEDLCASCVNLPSAKETAAWLEAALGRRYGERILVRYVDIHHPKGEEEAAFSRRVVEEDLWYPVVVIDNDIVGEGNPKLKEIRRKLDSMGLMPAFEADA
ncbi:YuzD family protein [Salinithrix halophila]|uniref:YuzD family protein n=1 Tax=Salinithrix halophila TaxID=1485204 RepID=A0ABV8JCI1_9BACL